MSEDKSTIEDASAAGQMPETVSGDEYADMVAAVDAAKQGQDVAVRQPEAPAAKPATAPEPEKPVEEQLPAVTAAIRKREAEHKQREEARTSAQTEAERIKTEALDKARAEAERIAQEIVGKAKAEAEAIYTTLRQKPIAAIKQAGWDPARLVDEVTREGDPVWQRTKELEAQIEELKGKTSETEKWRQAEAERQKQFETWQAEQRRQATVKEFTTLVAPETAPHLRQVAEQAHKMLSPFLPNMRTVDDWIILFGDHAHAQAVQATGGVASLADLVQHLEYQAGKLAAESGQQPTESQSTKPKLGRNGAQQPRAQGPRTLGSSTATERRASPRPPSEMTEAEIRAAMEAAAKEALNQR